MLALYLFISHHCPFCMGLFLYFRLFSYLMTVNLDGCSRQYILQILLKNPIKHPKSKCNFLSIENLSPFKNINFTYAQYDFWHLLLNFNPIWTRGGQNCPTLSKFIVAAKRHTVATFSFLTFNIIYLCMFWEIFKIIWCLEIFLWIFFSNLIGEKIYFLVKSS